MPRDHPLHSHCVMTKIEIPCRQTFKKRACKRGCKVSKSKSVRKSMVLNSRSIAGGPQILAPTAKYARNNLGT